MPFERSPASLAEVFAQILSTDPFSEMRATPMEAGAPTRRPVGSACVYEKTVHLTGRQLADLNGLLTVALNRRSFIWKDPTDQVDKLVIFADRPKLLSHPPTLRPYNMSRILPLVI